MIRWSALIAPLVAFDLATSGRVHRATLIRLAVTTIGVFVVVALTGGPEWHELTYGNALE